jgi:hypothetical protein
MRFLEISWDFGILEFSKILGFFQRFFGIFVSARSARYYAWILLELLELLIEEFLELLELLIELLIEEFF